MTNAEKLQDIQNEINKLLSMDKLSLDICQKLTYLEGAKSAFKTELKETNVNSLETNKNATRGKNGASEKELTDIQPALNNFIKYHTNDNLVRLCLEIQEFCQSVYALTENEEERAVYFGMIDNLKAD